MRTQAAEITLMRRDIRAQEREIRMLQRAGVSTASAELLVSRHTSEVRGPMPRARGLRETQRTQLVEAIRRHHAAFALASDSAVSIARI
jgi:hypothetical protein